MTNKPSEERTITVPELNVIRAAERFYKVTLKHDGSRSDIFGFRVWAMFGAAIRAMQKQRKAQARLLGTPAPVEPFADQLRSCLDLSLVHLPSASPNFEPLRSVDHGHGWIVFMDQDYNHDYKPEDFEEWFRPIFIAAKRNRVIVINFDSDGPRSALLPEFDW